MVGQQRRRSGILGFAILALCAAQPACAREVWNCTYEGAGDDSAHYVTHFEQRGDRLIEAHWPASFAYRILVDSRDTLVAVHAYAEPPSFRRDARAGAYVLIIDKRSGRLHRSATQSGESADQVLAGTCELR